MVGRGEETPLELYRVKLVQYRYHVNNCHVDSNLM